MKEYLVTRLTVALKALGISAEAPIVFDRPRQPEHGDLTTNVAMILARALRRNPRELAAAILERMSIDPDLVSSAEIAGPGFLNFRFTNRFFLRQLRSILLAGEQFGQGTAGRGKRAQVEFVSANPTGPLTVGHGRNAVIGDTVANLLEWSGYEVTREYYFNNAGRQMRVLGDSVRLRYLELLGDPVQFPEDYYQGEYIRDIARHVMEEAGDRYRDEPAEGKFKQQAEAEIFEDIKGTLRALGIVFQSFFNENSLYEEGKIAEVIGELRRRDLVYEQDGALWFRTSALGSEKDKVIVKSSGEPTYRLPDIAYHVEKFRKGYDLMVDIFGSDHIATYPDVLAGLRALGLDTERVKVLIYQFVTIVQNGEVVKMSTRKANFITLDELIRDVGPDVVRYFFLMRSITSHLNFDLGLARKQSDENPVYYLQYAHARIASIVRYAEEEGKRPEGEARFERLEEQAEVDLIKLLLNLPEVIESCAASYEPHRLADYLQEVATAFHRFYHECRVVTDDTELTGARLALCEATRIVLRNGFRVFGIAAPDRM
jgi:arginyl-tRNA synthetase